MHRWGIHLYKKGSFDWFYPASPHWFTVLMHHRQHQTTNKTPPQLDTKIKQQKGQQMYLIIYNLILHMYHIVYMYICVRILYIYLSICLSIYIHILQTSFIYIYIYINMSILQFYTIHIPVHPSIRGALQPCDERRHCCPCRNENRPGAKPCEISQGKNMRVSIYGDPQNG